MANFDHRAKIIILNKERKIALLNYRYGKYEKLVLPGGGVDYEDIVPNQYAETSMLNAAHRELREELKIDYDEAADLIFFQSLFTKPLKHSELDVIEREWLRDRNLYNEEAVSCLYLSFFIHVTMHHKPLLVNSLEIADSEKDKMSHVVWLSCEELDQACKDGHFEGTMLSRDVTALSEQIVRRAPRHTDNLSEVNWTSLVLLQR